MLGGDRLESDSREIGGAEGDGRFDHASTPVSAPL
jgi:hypothetical protein